MKRNKGYAVVLALLAVLWGCQGREEGQREESPVVLARNATQNKVTADTLRRRDFDRELMSNGRLVAGKRSELSFAKPGSIMGILRQNGDRVRKGDLIAWTDTLASGQALQRMRLGLEKAEMALWDDLIGYGCSLDSMEAVPAEVMKLSKLRSGYADAELAYRDAEKAFDQCFLKAPFDGKIVGIEQRVYEQASGVFCTLIDDDALSVRFPVLESEYAYVKEGMKVKVSPFAFQGRDIEGKIASVNPSVDENGQVMVEAVLLNDGSLVDGMNVRVTVCQRVPGCFVVPKDAVLLRDGREVLFLYREGKAVWTYVDILSANSREYAVEAEHDRGGEMEEGDLVIVSGNLNLVDGTDVSLQSEVKNN